MKVYLLMRRVLCEGDDVIDVYQDRGMAETAADTLTAAKTGIDSDVVFDVAEFKVIPRPRVKKVLV